MPPYTQSRPNDISVPSVSETPQSIRREKLRSTIFAVVREYRLVDGYHKVKLDDGMCVFDCMSSQTLDVGMAKFFSVEDIHDQIWIQ